MTILPPRAPSCATSTADREELAALVAHRTDPKPFGIDADNQKTGNLGTIAKAVTTGTAYAVTVADDVLAFDIDDEHHLDATHRLAADLRGQGLPVLLAPSGRPDHFHLWVGTPSAPVRARILETAKRLGLPPSRTKMRPPGSPHRLGLPVDLPDDWRTFSAALIAGRAPGRQSFDWRTVLHSGRWPKDWKGDSSASSMVWFICIGASRSGISLEAMRSRLADPTNKGGRGYRDRLSRGGKSHADYWLDNYVWPTAIERSAVLPPKDATEARERLDTIAEAVAAHRWRGVGGSTERAILIVLIDRAQKRGSLTPTMSFREIAEVAPCSRRTVGAATSRLAKAGWLQRVEKGRGRTIVTDGVRTERADATQWRICLSPDARTFPTSGTPLASTSLSGATSRVGALESRARLDVCRWRGVGLNAPRVLDVLAVGPLTAGEIADALRMNAGNMRARLLPRLADHGLIEVVDGRWSLVDDLEAALEWVADELDLTGKAAEVAAVHAEERADYLDHRDRTRDRRDVRERTYRRSAIDDLRRRRAAEPQLWEPIARPTEPPDGYVDPPDPPEPHKRLLVASEGNRVD